MQVDARTDGPKATDPALELGTLVGFDAGELARRGPGLVDHVVVDHAHAVLADRPHAELALEGHAELAHEDDVELGPEPLGDLGRHRDPATGQAQDDDVTAAQVDEGLGQAPAGVGPVSERHGPRGPGPNSPSRPPK